MRRDFAEFLALTAQDRRDVFETAAGRLDTPATSRNSCQGLPELRLRVGTSGCT